MRRGSIIGPVVLIALGGLFLMNNLRPELSVLDLFFRYWPFLLIGWGALRLFEVIFWFFRGRQIPSRGVSGGEWVLVVFICLIGSGAFFVRRNLGSFPPGNIRIRGIEVFGEAFDYPLNEKTAMAGKNPRVVIENLRGNAKIVGADTTEVRVSGRKTIRAIQRHEADNAHQATPLELVVQGNTVIIRTNQERAFSERHVSADLEITVPKGATIEGRGRMGDFDVSGIEGAVEINSDNAGVRVQNITGNVRVDLRRSDIVRAVNVKGEVELKGRGEAVELENIAGPVTVNGTYYGDLQFRNIEKPLRIDGQQTEVRIEKCPGELRVSRGHLDGSDLIGPIHIQARTKDVQLSGFTNGLNLQLERGHVELRPGRIPLGKMEVRTGTGDIVLALPEGAKFELKANVKKGEAQNEFGDALKVDSEGRHQSITGSVGGGPSISLESDRGTITVRKGILEPVPPVPPKPPYKPAEAVIQ